MTILVTGGSGYIGSHTCIELIKENYDIKEFFNTRLPNFKIMASIYKLFGTEVGREDFGPIQKTDSAITITEHITQNTTKKTKSNKLVEDLIEDDMEAEKAFRAEVKEFIDKTIDIVNNYYSSLHYFLFLHQIY